MKRMLCVALLGALAQGAMAADVGVSISIGDPNFYGRIDIGNFPRPVLIYPQPMVIQQAPYGVVRQPLYLRVPPGHAKHWRKYCARYRACGYPVYFVRDNWYREVYAPRYREAHPYRDRPPVYGGERYEERRERRDDRFDERRDRHEQRFDDRRERREERFDDRRDRREQRLEERRERFEERGDRGDRGGRGDRGDHGHGRGHRGD